MSIYIINVEPFLACNMSQVHVSCVGGKDGKSDAVISRVFSSLLLIGLSLSVLISYHFN